MREVDSLSRRYQALDDLIQELSMVVSSRGGFDTESRTDVSDDDPSIRLMCEFWDILKEDPDCNLTQAVKHRMGVSNVTSTVFGPRHVTCYMAESGKKCGQGNKKCCHKENKDTSKEPSMKESTSSYTCKRCAGKNKPKTDDTPLQIKDSDEEIQKKTKYEVNESPASKDIRNEYVKKIYITPEVPTKEYPTPKVKLKMPTTGDPIKKAKGSEQSSTCKRCSNKERIKSPARSVPVHNCGQGPPPKTTSSPINKALCSLKQAASHDKKCNDKIRDLLQSQSQLKVQIQNLEQRETQGLQMIKKADCMWTCMEDCYKKKLEESQQRQKDLLKELKKVEENNNKWRKNNKDLEFQMNNLNKLQQELTDKTNQKKNDTKVIDTEIVNLKKRVDNYNKETDAIKKSMENRKNASNMQISNYCVEIKKYNEELSEENQLKSKKEQEGNKYIKEARDDLQKICKVLLQKRMQNEDLRAEKKALEDEIDLLNQTLDQCKDKCSLKQKRMKDEIQKLTDEINNYKHKCVRCHQVTDTDDIRKLCNDCPKCERDRLCKDENGYCVIDPYMDCVCQSVKQKFLDNVFENMYTVLARQSKSAPGKAVADVILKCLRKSTNGKLNKETRNIVQDFILTTVKKNLNLTIVGGAVKTRCEMDRETYDQLMSCLKDVQAIKPPTEDKGTAAKKPSCGRWGGTNECNCPGGPKKCVCTKKAPPPLEEPGPNPPPDVDDPGEVVKCPHHKDKVSCGVDCAMHKGSNEHPDWKRDPCKTPTSCNKFSTNMRAAQCVLGPEQLINMPKRHNGPIVVPIIKDKIKSKRGEKPKEQCVCGQGTYQKKGLIRMERECLCSRLPIFDQNYLGECNSGSDWIIIDGLDALKEKLLQKRNTHICHPIERYSPTVSKVEGRAKEFEVLLHPKKDITQNYKSIIVDADHSKTKYHTTNISKITKDMTDMIVSDLNKEEYFDDSGVKWMTIDAFIKQLSTSNNSLADKNEKQLKAGFPEKSTDNGDVMRMLTDKKEKYDAYTEISHKAKKIHTEYKEDEILSNGGKKCLKIIVDQNRSNSDISLTKTSSGKLGIVLNENIVKIIDQMTLTDPQLIASLDRDKKLTFHYERSDDDNEYDIFIKRSSSGTRQLEVVKNFIDAINTKRNTTEIPIKIHKNTSKHDKNTSITDLRLSSKGSKNRNHSISKALSKIYEESKSVKLTVQGENGLRKSIHVPLTRTLSGDIALDVTKVLSLGEIAMNCEEHPVKLTRTKTNSFLLKITKHDNDSNAIIRITCSGYLLLLPLKEVLKCTDTVYTPPKEKYFGLNIKDGGSYVSQPKLMVKPTSSKEYLVVVDKEYVKSYNRAISDCFGDDAECCIQLFRTKSYNFEVHVDETNDFNARIVKSPLGEIKIVHEELNENVSNKKKFKTLHDLLESSSITSNEPRIPFDAPRLTIKPYSDSSSLDRVKVLTPDNRELLLQPSELIKTDSEQYAVILNKSSKKALIKNLRTYLKNNDCHGLIPVKIMNPGETTIALGSDYNNKTAFGSLKVTHSGNIYLILNKTDVATEFKIDKKNINVGQTISFTGVKSQHYIDKVQQPVNKAIATNCRAYSNSSFCDSSKCLCAQLHTCTKNGRENMTSKDIKEHITSKDIKESLMSLFSSRTFGVEWKQDIKTHPDENYKLIDKTSGCNERVCNQSFCYKSRSSVKALSKCDCIKPVSSNHHHSRHQCFFVDTLYSYYVGQDNSASNDLLDIPATFNKSMENNMESKRILYKAPKQSKNVDWEAIENLPPQLPYFLTQSILPKLVKCPKKSVKCQ